MSSYKKLQDKLSKANGNILILIEEVIRLKEKEMQNYCCKYHLNDECGRCDECKDAYWENQTELMEEMFYIE